MYVTYMAHICDINGDKCQKKHLCNIYVAYMGPFMCHLCAINVPINGPYMYLQT